MRGLVFIGKFPTEFGSKNCAFSTKKSGKSSHGPLPGCSRHMAGVHKPKICALGVCFMLKAHECTFLRVIACFFVFWGVCFHIICLGTWEQNFSLCNVFQILLNLQSWFSHDLYKSSRCSSLPICMISS